MKKYIFAVAGVMTLASNLVASAAVVNGSALPVSGTGVASPGTASPGVVVSPTIYPVPVPPPGTVDSGFLQFNNLTIESISAQAVPAEIVATLGYPTIVPMMGASGASAGAAEGAAPQSTTAPRLAAPPSNVTCYKYDSQEDSTGTAITCPTLPATSSTDTRSAPAAPASPSTGAPNSAAIASPPNFMYRPYRIEVDASTKLSLRDRTPATLADFAPGDTINVFGYYNSDGSIQAYLVRDLSKPAEQQVVQLENMTLISVSATTPPATLAMTQTEVAPCYGFDQNDVKAIRVCPMGVQSFSANTATQNVQAPAAMMPNWAMLRKYVVNVSAQTIILDHNRTKLTLVDLQAGDTLNVYGGTSDNGQTIDADIVRDLSIPAAPATLNGTIKQVNADGSFVISTSDGRVITVQSPVQVGATVTLTGILDTLKGVLSQISQMYFGNNAGPGVGEGGSGSSGGGTVVPPTPMPLPMMRVNGAPEPTSTGGKPNIY